ncbi:hypothetical protein [Actibacterium sp. MT2.3-13A]|uniref:hypothetical protein n=1 Tax=Actibacterium sp. MT2.3-13A TaxID=2828332 RepID=UPI001BA9683F|nr:hypothetical protein [Actibacterium sp. MT2.3-13A]
MLPMKPGRGSIPYLAAVLWLVFVVCLVLFGSQLIGEFQERAMPAASDPTTVHASIDALIEAGDQIASMLTTLTLALFVVVGFTMSNANRSVRDVGVPSVVAGLLFFLMAVLSLFFGFAARAQTLDLLTFTYDGYDDLLQEFRSLQVAFGRQALFLVLSATGVVFVASEAVVRK